MGMKPNFELLHRDVRRKFVVELSERQTELGTKFFQRDFRKSRLLENVVGRFPDRGQIIHQSSRPIEDDISNHATSLRSEALRSEHSLQFGQQGAVARKFA